MKRTRVIVIVLVFVILGGVLANAAVRSRTNARVTGPATDLIRTTKNWARGPAAEYEFDSGNIFVVDALRLTLPSGPTYDVVVTLSMDYRTSPGPDRFNAGVTIRKGAQYGPIVRTTPIGRSVPAAQVDASTTLTFQVSGLVGGTEYWIAPGVNVSHRDNKARIVSSRVLMIVDATPS